jgi:hypothetical protein
MGSLNIFYYPIKRQKDKIQVMQLRTSSPLYTLFYITSENQSTSIITGKK